MKKISKILIVIMVVLLLTLILFKTFCPILEKFPIPTGQYSVGIINEHWIDISLHFQPRERNEFNVQIFYPSNSDKSKIFPYQPQKIDALKKTLPKQFPLPSFIWHCLLSNIYSYSQFNAPIVDNTDKYNVIIYLPGIGSEDLHNLYLEELASHGYVIVAIEPTMDILVTVFPDNKIIELDSRLVKAVKENDREAIYKYRDEAHERWSKYIEFTISRLKQLNEDKQSIFYQKLDIGKIGIMGHSHGGAVALDFCQKNKLCNAGINMDGWTKTYNQTKSFDTPFMFMINDGMDMPGMQNLFKNNLRRDFEIIMIPGTRHGSFTDGILQKSLSRVLGITRENYDEHRKEISKKIVSFFDKYLKK